MVYLVLVYGDAMITLKHRRDHCSIDCNCVVQHGLRIHDTCDDACNLTCNYLKGNEPPNYPVPAIRAMVNNAQRLIQFGEITAENGFDLQTVFERYVKLR